jgi:hypothetical protein
VFAILPYLAHTPLLEGTNMREDQCVGQEEPEEKKVEGEEKPSLIDDLPRYQLPVYIPNITALLSRVCPITFPRPRFDMKIRTNTSSLPPGATTPAVPVTCAGK